MTKYARTKCNKIVKVNLEGDVFTCKHKIIGELKNTIEELCDEFVMIVEDKHIRFDHFKDVKSYALKFKHKLYGAIWTNEGLIYVAKMNNAGELELM